VRITSAIGWQVALCDPIMTSDLTSALEVSHIMLQLLTQLLHIDGRDILRFIRHVGLNEIRACTGEASKTGERNSLIKYAYTRGATS